MAKGKKAKKDKPQFNTPYFISIIYEPGYEPWVDTTLGSWELQSVLGRILEREMEAMEE